MVTNPVMGHFERAHRVIYRNFAKYYEQTQIFGYMLSCSRNYGGVCINPKSILISGTYLMINIQPLLSGNKKSE